MMINFKQPLCYEVFILVPLSSIWDLSIFLPHQNRGNLRNSQHCHVNDTVFHIFHLHLLLLTRVLMIYRVRVLRYSRLEKSAPLRVYFLPRYRRPRPQKNPCYAGLLADRSCLVCKRENIVSICLLSLNITGSVGCNPMQRTGVSPRIHGSCAQADEYSNRHFLLTFEPIISLRLKVKSCE